MKIQLRLLVFLFPFGLLITSPLYAAFGIYESYTVVGGTYYDLFATTINPDFAGTNLGTFVTGSTLAFNGGQIKTYKESRSGCSGNCCGGTIYWVVKNGATSYTSGNNTLSYNSGFGDQLPMNSCSVNQQWDNNASGTANILAGLSVGNYTLEVYCASTGSQGANSGCGDLVTQSVQVASFTITAPAPVELIQFNIALVEKNQASLSWETASERNNNYFEIQRSTDSRNWKVLDQVFTQNGNARYHQSYIYLDKHPDTEVNYYRLRQVDLHGDFEYSKIIQARFDILPTVRVSPNPVEDIVWLTFEKTDQVSTGNAQIFDAMGNLIKEWYVQELRSSQPFSLDLSAMPKGLLFLHINGFEVQKIVKQ